MPLLSNGQLSNGSANAGRGGSQKAPSSIRDMMDAVRSSTQPYVAGSAGNAVGSRNRNANWTSRDDSDGYVAGSASSPVGARSKLMSRPQESSTDDVDYLAQMRSAAEAKTGVGDEAGDAEEAAGTNRVDTADDMFEMLFNGYSNKNLGGMSLGEFLNTDGSQERRDMWRAFTEDPLGELYYGDEIEQAGGFDNWYDQKTGVTFDEIMADPELQRRYFGGSDKTVHAIHQFAVENGWIPAVLSDAIGSTDLTRLFESDPSLSATVMDYMFAMNALNNQEDVSDVFSVNEMNNLLALDGLEFGYGDGYTYGDHSVPDEGEQFLAVDPEFWIESLQKGWSSVPGYGLSNRGAAGLMHKRYDTGFARRPGVDDAYASYAQQQGGDQQ